MKREREAKLNSAESELNKGVAKLSSAKKTTPHDAKLTKSAK